MALVTLKLRGGYFRPEQGWSGVLRKFHRGRRWRTRRSGGRLPERCMLRIVQTRWGSRAGTFPEERRPRNALRGVILPALFAIALAAAVEAVVHFAFHPTFWQKTAWLMHDPYRSEIFDRNELYIRLSHLEDSDPDVISVGDSSGFFSLQSKVVNHYSGGLKFLSLNTGANQAYSGYLGIAEYMLQRSKHLKYVVLYIYPQLLPEEEVIRVADLGPIVRENLASVRAYVTPPSAALSAYAKSLVFEHRRFRYAAPLSNHMPSLQLSSTVDDTLGWLPEFDVRFDRINGRLDFYSDERTAWYDRLGLTEPSSIVAELGAFEEVVRSHGARLVVAFARRPLGKRARRRDCRSRAGALSARASGRQISVSAPDALGRGKVRNVQPRFEGVHFSQFGAIGQGAGPPRTRSRIDTALYRPGQTARALSGYPCHAGWSPRPRTARSRACALSLYNER
jgi:hypothetical protein